MSETVTVTVELDRKPTIEDIQSALDTLRAEGIPDSFEVGIVSSEDRKYEEGVPYGDRIVTRLFRVSAERAAKSA